MSFKHLQEAEISDKVAQFAMPMLQGKPVLVLRPANKNNPFWIRAALALPKSKQRLFLNAANTEQKAELQGIMAELYSKHVLIAWANVVDDEGNEVPFSQGAAEEFLRLLPWWVLEELCEFAENNRNFVGGDEAQILGNLQTASAGTSNTKKRVG